MSTLMPAHMSYTHVGTHAYTHVGTHAYTHAYTHVYTHADGFQYRTTRPSNNQNLALSQNSIVGGGGGGGGWVPGRASSDTMP